MRFRSELTMHFGDYRVISSFALWPVRAQQPGGSCIVWLEYYDVVQKYYYSVGWDTQALAISGYGIVLATRGAKLWNGKVREWLQRRGKII